LLFFYPGLVKNPGWCTLYEVGFPTGFKTPGLFNHSWKNGLWTLVKPL